MRLGEALVKEGLINNDILARALERQIIFGGRLGTNLVEMGALSEENLAKFLSKNLQVPYAEPSLFENVPQEVLDAFPLALASKYTAFPIKKERSKIHLAMKDPNDIPALDDIRFITGLDPKAYIASEIRIVFALEKYYGIKRDLRYISLLEEDKPQPPSAFKAPVFAQPADKPAPAPTPKPLDPETFLGDESQVDVYTVKDTVFDFEHETPSEPKAPPVPVPVSEPEPVQAAPSPVVQAPRQAPPAAETIKKEVRGISSPYGALASPIDREHIAEALLAGALQHLSRAVLFLVKGNTVTGWMAGGAGLDTGMASAITIALDGPSIFKEVVEEKSNYKGPVLRVPLNVQLLDSLGGVYPQEAVACPLVIKGKVVSVLYGDNGQDSMIKDINELIGLMSKGSMSLEILILKNKILG